MQAVNRRWFGDRLWILLNLTPNELREIFPEQTWDNLKNKRKIYRRQIRVGNEVTPSKPVWYEHDMTTTEIRENINDESVSGKSTEEIADYLIDQRTREYLHRLLDETLDNTNVNPAHVKGFRVTAGSHEGYIKNNDGEIEYTKDLKHGGINLYVDPKSFEPKWPVIHQPLADIHPLKAARVVTKNNMKTCVVIPDPQIGFRRFGDGSTDPFHDDNAISIALQVIADSKPDKVVCLGDFLDLPMFGRFEQSEDYAHTAQMAINYGYRMLAMIRATLPKSEIVVIEGNHDFRLASNIQKNSMSAFGIKRADDTNGWPVFSVPYLLNFDKLNVKYIEGYPAGKYWINERLQCIHGHIVRAAGATAAAVVKSETVSTIFGHVHRIETAYDTQNVYGGARANLAHTPGCLCRIDGAVPSTRGGIDLDGRPIKSFENWQQGMVIVDYEDGDGAFNLHPIYINTFQNYKTTVNGVVYEPSKEIIDQLNTI